MTLCVWLVQFYVFACCNVFTCLFARQIVHIKRFRYSSIRREKMTTDVTFPTEDFDLSPYLSVDRCDLSHTRSTTSNTNNINGSDSGTGSGQQSQQPPPALPSSIAHLYDLIAVAQHSGGLMGGHYTAHCCTSNFDLKGSKDTKWSCFNDDRVSATSKSDISGPSAYVLFYIKK